MDIVNKPMQKTENTGRAKEAAGVTMNYMAFKSTWEGKNIGSLRKC